MLCIESTIPRRSYNRQPLQQVQSQGSFNWHFVPNLDLFLEILIWRKEKDKDRRLLKRAKPLVCFTFAIMVNMLVNEAFIFVVLPAIHSEP